MKRVRVLAGVTLALTACAIPPQPGGGSPQPETHVYGDSLLTQVVATPIEDGDGRTYHALSSAPLAHWADSVIATYHEGPADVVLAMPNNELLDGSWDEGDIAVWSWVLAAAQSDDCVVAVKPWFQPIAETTYPGLLDAVNDARDWLDEALPGRIVDWQPTVETHPEVMAADGIHLAAFGLEITPAVQARYDMLTAAARLCETRSTP